MDQAKIMQFLNQLNDAVNDMSNYLISIQPTNIQPDVNVGHPTRIIKFSTRKPSTDITPTAVGRKKRVLLTAEQRLENGRLAVTKCRNKNKAPKKIPMTPYERKQKYNMKKAVAAAVERTSKESLNALINKGVE